MTSNTHTLTGIEYAQAKHRITLEFANFGGKKSKSFPFFPSFFFEKKIPAGELSKLLCNYNPQKFEIIEHENSFEVKASTFFDLKCLANLCLNSFGKRPVLIEPERQFLAANNWSYFDSFDLAGKFPQKIECTDFPNALWNGLASLNEVAKELLEHDNESANEFINSIAVSKLLCIHPENSPTEQFVALETFLENLFFSHGFDAPSSQDVPQRPCRKSPVPPNSIEMDFSMLWPTLFTKPFYNLGFESIDCSCCSPNSLFDRNVLPHSTVNARVLSEGFYFESLIPGFEQQFHEQALHKESRERLKKEFYLNYFPVGPFARNQEVELLLCDALNQASGGKAELVSTTQLHWFCLRRESFLSKALCALNEQIAFLSAKISSVEKDALQEHGLASQEALLKDSSFVFRKALCRAMLSIYRALPGHLTNQHSKFFSKQVADSIVAVQASALNRFSKLVMERNGRIMCKNHETAFIRAKNPMSIAEEFSRRERVPAVVSRVKTRK